MIFRAITRANRSAFADVWDCSLISPHVTKYLHSGHSQKVVTTMGPWLVIFLKYSFGVAINSQWHFWHTKFKFGRTVFPCLIIFMLLLYRRTIYSDFLVGKNPVRETVAYIAPLQNGGKFHLFPEIQIPGTYWCLPGFFPLNHLPCGLSGQTLRTALENASQFHCNIRSW